MDTFEKCSEFVKSSAGLGGREEGRRQGREEAREGGREGGREEGRKGEGREEGGQGERESERASERARERISKWNAELGNPTTIQTLSAKSTPWVQSVGF